jgi:glutathione peroxidase-family protein
MPVFQVKLAQGKRSLNEEVEAKSLESLLSFYETCTTMKVMEVRKIVFVAPSDVRPIDDNNYNSLFKTFAKNDTTGISRQFIFHNLKKTKNENEIFAMMKECFEVNGAHIDTIYSSLFKA